jgi:predicted HTH transcriptional regulator
VDFEELGLRIRAGEGSTVEWKRELSSVDRAGAILCSFLNGTGGLLVVGIADDGERVGAPDPPAAVADLREAASRLLPPQEIAIHDIPLDAARSLVVAEVTPARKPPVLMWHTDGEEVAYVRDGPSTRRAERDDLRALSSAMGREPGEDDLDDHEVDCLRAIAAMPNTAMKAVVHALHRGRRDGRLTLKRLQRRGYLVRLHTGRFRLTPFAHEAIEKRR